MVAQANVFRTLSHFLQTVHSFPVEQARRFGVAEDDVQKSYAEFWDENKDKIFPLLNREYQQRLEVAFQEYLGNPGNFQYKPSLLYADLAPEHILFNTKKAEIVGVIDWGDVIIGDPDFDLMYLYRYYGEDFLNSFLNYYQHQDREALLRKIKLFCVCDYIETILEPAYKRDQAQELHKLHEVLLDGWPLVNSSQPKLACA
jgi:aminoglycoside 2''-phosphotransferase